MSKTEIGNYPALDRAEKLLQVVNAYFNVTDFELNLFQLQALYRDIDRVLNTIRSLSFESCIESELRTQKFLLNRKIRDLVKEFGYDMSRKRRSLPNLDLDDLLKKIQELKEKKVA